MHLSRSLLLAALLVAATGAGTAASADIVPGVKNPVTSVLPGPQPAYGLMVDAGVPGGGRASLVYRPFWFLRAHAGAGYNLVAPGVHAGLSIVPVPYWITPSIGAEVGTYFEGDANPAVRLVTGDADFENAMLQRFGYDYATGWAGLEIGQRRATFYIHAGYSIMQSTVHGAQDMIPAEAMVTLEKDPVITVKAVSARLGLIVYLF